MELRVIELAQGNIDNNYLHLSSIMDFFPASSVGGTNESELGTLLEVHCGIAAPVLTDIAGDKKIFRKRSWVGEFFESHGLAAGSKVVIEKTGANRYHIYPARG